MIVTFLTSIQTTNVSICIINLKGDIQFFEHFYSNILTLEKKVKKVEKNEWNVRLDLVQRLVNSFCLNQLK